MTDTTEWKCRINGGPIQTFSTKSSKYWLAVATALATLDYAFIADNDHVEIWGEGVMPDYGPYLYGFDGHDIYSKDHPGGRGWKALEINASKVTGELKSV